MLIQRRNFLIGLTAALAAPAIVRIQNIMPVRTIIEPEQMMKGIRWQSWPFGVPAPDNWLAHGSIGTIDSKLRPASYFESRLDEYRKAWPDLHWQPIGARAPMRLTDR